MPYITSVPGNPITASLWNANVRDQGVTPFATAAARNAAITSPIAGMLTYVADVAQLHVYNGSAWVCITPVVARVETFQTTNSTVFTDLATAGPQVQVYVATKALVTVTTAFDSAAVGAGGFMSVAVGAPTNFAATTSRALETYSYQAANIGGQYSQTFLVDTVAGLNTFTAKYRSTSATAARFGWRQLTVVGIP
jgi:hypothetical protein